MAGGDKKEGADAVNLPQVRVLVFGDNQVRHLVSAFCARERKRRSRVCFLGTRIGKVADRLDKCMANDGAKPIIFFLISGGNDLDKVRSEELFGTFRQAFG